MAAIHHRMPVILDDQDLQTWLDPDNQDLEKLKSMLDPFPMEQMHAYVVSDVVNNSRNDLPTCIVPILDS